jgi:hypothetical protein
MYQAEDVLKSTGYMRNFDHVNNGCVNPAFGAFMAFNPMVPSLPEVRIIDRRLETDWTGLIKKYNTVIQNYRMISDGRKTGWPKKHTISRTAAIGLDEENSVLFILAQFPSTTSELIERLLSLPIKIRDAMYVEGGVEANLYFGLEPGKIPGMNDAQRRLFRYEGSESGWPIPNVIGIVKGK